MEYQIREFRQEEYGVLNEFLYEAIFIPEGVEAPPEVYCQEALPYHCMRIFGGRELEQR